MNSKDFDALVDREVQLMKDLLQHKGGEYASGDDRLANFKETARQLRIKPILVWAIYFHKHLDAIATFVADEQADKTRIRMEPIDGRFRDAANYLLLGLALLEEARAEKEEVDTVLLSALRPAAAVEPPLHQLHPAIAARMTEEQKEAHRRNWG